MENEISMRSSGTGSDAAQNFQFTAAPVGLGYSPSFWQPLFCRRKYTHRQLHTEKEKGFKTP